MQNQIIESKRQNKLLKLAIGRLQNELDKKDKVLTELNQPPPFSVNNALSGQEEKGGTTFITETKTEKPLTGVVPLEGSELPATQEDTVIKVMNSNENEKPETAEGNQIDNVFTSKIGQSNAYPEISQIYGIDASTVQTSYFESKMASRQQPGS